MLSVSGTSTSRRVVRRVVRRVTISVGHAMKLLVTIIDSRHISAYRSRAIRAAKLFRYAFGSSYPARYVCYAHKRSTVAPVAS